MNAFRNTLQRNVLRASRRFASTAVPKPPVPEIYQYSFRKAFLQDPSTYPLLVVMTVAGCFIAGMSINAFTQLKDLRIRPQYKHETLQNWGDYHRVSVVEAATRQPMAFHAQAFKDIRQEGLGVDHEAWKRSKGL